MRWIKLDTAIRTDDKVALLPSDNARWAWIAVLVAAGAQDGRPWKSFKHLDACLSATERKHVKTLVAAGLVEEAEDGHVVIPGWSSHQVPMRFQSKGQRHGSATQNHATATQQRDQIRGQEREKRNPLTPLRGRMGGGTESVGALMKRLGGE
jgi:hypothetical protein